MEKDGLSQGGGSRSDKKSGGHHGKPSGFPDGLEMKEESQMTFWPEQLEANSPQLRSAGRLQMGQSSVRGMFVKLGYKEVWAGGGMGWHIDSVETHLSCPQWISDGSSWACLLGSPLLASLLRGLPLPMFLHIPGQSLLPKEYPGVPPS